jgi:hypothetical protein
MSKPIKKFRVGGVSAAVWKNNDDFYSVTLQKSYKDEGGEWKNTDSLNHGDLLNAAKALERAESYISSQ